MKKETFIIFDYIVSHIIYIKMHFWLDKQNTFRNFRQGSINYIP